MDKGAHFFNCDFQVHTPRDLNWTGEKYGITPDEVVLLTEKQKAEIMERRYCFANKYLSKARESGLNAIAITDHHDVEFAKIIRKVAQERNAKFIESLQFDKCITVFPGMELTLSNPACQCLIIFDSDFPDSDLDSVVNFLGLNPNNKYEKNHSQICRISEEITQNLNKLHKRLDELKYCKGKYIIFPNVNKNGKFTILRQGFNEHYSKMPCVGGYVDKEISRESGYLNKLNGGDHNYGNKAIGVVSTSDNRNQDGKLFGHYSTWVKWEEPTAEALRQACLARESRLSQESPELPQIFIFQLKVINSRFLGSFVVEFNSQYNALIGGRGTGKSTILEYLRWGLCDQTNMLDDKETRSDLETRRQNLIEKTLVPYNGEVLVTFSVNGIIHIVKRNSVTKEIYLKIGSADFKQVKEEQIRTILPIQAYSQKQLSSVGVRTEELKRFIQQPIGDQLSKLSFQLIDISKKTRSVYSNYLRKMDMQKEKDQLDLQIRSLKDQVSNLRNSLKGISEDDQKIIASKQLYDNEQNLIDQAKMEFSTVYDHVSELIKSLSKYPEPYDLKQPLVNTPLLESINDKRTEIFDKIKEVASQLQDLCNEENQQDLIEKTFEWTQRKAKFQAQYETAKNNTSSNQMQLSEIHNIEKKLQELSNNVTDRVAKLKDIGTPEEDFDNLRNDWFTIHQQKLTLLTEQSHNLSTLSKGCIKAEYSNNFDTSKIKEQMTIALQGTRIREDKLQYLCNYIKNSDPPLDAWHNILNELRIIAELKFIDGTKYDVPVTPILTQCKFSQKNIEKIAFELTPEKWLDLALVIVDFTPEFKYLTNNSTGDTIPFSDASAGQQATALLTVLLNQPGSPLVIDQPEDDIDNRAIRDIIKNIWVAKKRRQIIFTSHNANIVVNGDAELVICCDYLDSGNQTQGQIKAEGSIDSKTIKDEITYVMEGGEKAFRLRKDKYGF